MMNCTRYKTSQSNVAPSDGGRTEALVPLWVMRAIPAARSGDDGSRHPRPLQQLLPVRPELAVRVYVPIERLAGDAELGAQLADLSTGLADGGLRQAELGRGHLERPAAVTTAARAEAKPARVRSMISSRSNSARAAKCQTPSDRWRSWCRGAHPDLRAPSGRRRA